MKHKIAQMFCLKNSRKTKRNLTPIYLRITINGERYEEAIHRQVEISEWSKISGRMKGKSSIAEKINTYLDAIRTRVFDLEREMVFAGESITYESFRNKWSGVGESPKLILQLFEAHNEEVAQLVGKDFSAGTLKRYKTSLRHTRNFIQWKYKVNDMDIKKLNYEFITSYAFWFKTVRDCNHNTTMKYLTNFKKIVFICIKNNWLDKDPFFGFKFTKVEVERPFLTEQEISRIAAKVFKIERLEYVRDIFLFCCYTGLAYVDVQKLKRDEINVGIDGEKWIFANRQKTDEPLKIPLLPFAVNVVKKYREHEGCIIKNRVLPVFSNQKMNAYLKEIADVCGIHKNLTFHVARHTFATTVTLNNDVPIETVSKLLGHKNLRTTQHYAKILDLKVSRDMQSLKQKLSDKSDFNNL
jgi:integrase